MAKRDTVDALAPLSSDSFELLLDEAPTLLDLLVDSFEDDATVDAQADAVAVRGLRRPSGEEYQDDTRVLAKKSKPKPKTKSNTWRQRRRLDVLRLREEVKQLDAELKQMKLAVGVRSTVPLLTAACIIQAPRSGTRSEVKRLLGESWQDAASRESLARQMADAERERLHKVLQMQVKHARKLHRMITQQMTTAVVAQALGFRPGLVEDDCLPPNDNNAVFQKLLAELDRHDGNMSSVFVTKTLEHEQQVTINRTRGLQVHLFNSYTVPFSMEATERAVWTLITKISNEDSRVAYGEVGIDQLCAIGSTPVIANMAVTSMVVQLFKVDSSTAMQSVRTFVVHESTELCFLVRKGCRKYINDGQTHFVAHETSSVTTSFGGGVSYEEVLWRTVKRSKDEAGGPTTIIESHVLATFPSYKTLGCLPPEGLNGFHVSLRRFNHKIEDLLVKNEIRKASLE